MTGADGVEYPWRRLAPQVLGAMVRRYGNFADAEDAVQEALLAAATTWPEQGTPDEPLAWLIRVASRRMADQFRSQDSRRRREEAVSAPLVDAGGELPVPSGVDDTLLVMTLCCHPALSPSLAIPLTLRAVGGLTTREIASAFLVPEATMAQRISRAKAKVRATGLAGSDQPQQLSAVLRVLYLMFSEGHATQRRPRTVTNRLVDRGDSAGPVVGCRPPG